MNQFYNIDNINASTQELKNIVHEKMKLLTTHVEDIDNYDEIMKQLGNANFLDPETTNNILANRDKETISKRDMRTKKPSIIWKLLKAIVGVNSIIPLLIYKFIEPNIQEAEFVSTTKLAIGITAFPLFYAVQALFVHYFFGLTIALIYVMLSILLLFILTKTKPST